MTEKRFIYIKLGDRDEIQDYIIDNNQNNHFKHKEYHFNNISDFEDLFDMLNNLVAENEQLKKENEKLESLWEDKCIKEYMELIGENALQEMHNEKYGDK